MSPFAHGVLALLGLDALVSVVRKALGDTQEELDVHRARAKAQFLTLRVDSAHPRYAITPETVEIVKEEEDVDLDSVGSVRSYTLRRFLRNASGDYFLFTSCPNRPYIKLVAHSTAKAALGDKYVL